MFAQLLKLSSKPLTAQHYTEYGAIRTFLPLNDTHVLQDFDITSVYGEVVSFLSHITRELANFSQPVDKLWDSHSKLICYILYMSEDAYSYSKYGPEIGQYLILLIVICLIV